MPIPTVLVVDDHAPTREAYGAFLMDSGFRVFEAAHGGEAILQVHRHPPDVVLMDIAMPVLDGLETAQWLRENSPTTHLPILGITGSTSCIEQERMRRFCYDLLLKPCAPELIASRIRTLTRVSA
jgi:CheY-like chemotaxis protein